MAWSWMNINIQLFLYCFGYFMVFTLCEVEHNQLNPPHVPSVWYRTQYPNPQVDVHSCGRRGSPSSVCDPNHLIQYIQANELDRMISQLRNETRCACTGFVCNEDEVRGYGVWILLLNEMQDENSRLASERDESPNVFDNLRRARLFAYTQHVVWSLTECDVVILYARNDDVLYTIAGTEANKLLTDEIIASASLAVRSQLTANVYTGLKMLFSTYRSLFLQQH